MILKVFVLINKKGRALADGSNVFIESDDITVSPIRQGESVLEYSAKVINKRRKRLNIFGENSKDFETVYGEINLKTHGYELYNEEGKVIERFIAKDSL